MKNKERNLWTVDRNPEEETRQVVVDMDTLQALLVDHANTAQLLDNWFATKKGI